jgi:hypothetical protein
MRDEENPKDPVRPPRWAEALLRLALTPEEAETESGDLLEAYRDSVYPVLGRRRANLWFIGQTGGYILRAATKKNPRNIALGSLAFCALLFAFSVFLYPCAIRSSDTLKAVGVFFLAGCLVVKWTRPTTLDDALVLRLATRWGLALGTLWTLSLASANLVAGLQVFMLLTLAAVFVPFVVGAHLGIKTQRVLVGTRAGGWSGLVSGLMLFPALTLIGYLCAFIPGLPGAEIPRSLTYTATEFQSLNVFDALGGAFSLFIFEGIFGLVAGTIGATAGILLERTGHDPDMPPRS